MNYDDTDHSFVVKQGVICSRRHLIQLTNLARRDKLVYIEKIERKRSSRFKNTRIFSNSLIHLLDSTAIFFMFNW